MGYWKWIWILFVIGQKSGFVSGLISVRFKPGADLYVALDRTLLLEAEVQKTPQDIIDMVTWELQRGSDNVRISPNDRISLEKDQSHLRIKRVRPEDYGMYKVTVTDSSGQQEYASIQVRKMAAPPKASIVLDCSVENVRQWDSPQFTWMVDDIVMTNQTRLLGHGCRLNISEVPGHNYTCMINSSLGLSTAQYLRPKEESKTCHCARCYDGLIAFGVLCVIISICLGVFVKWKKGRTRQG